MLRRVVFMIIAVVSVAVCAVAQPGAPLTGRLMDNDTAEGVMGAVVELSPINKPAEKRYVTSDRSGYFRFGSVAAGRYRIVASFIGYKDREVTVQTQGLPKAMGDIMMQSSAIDIEAVAVTAVTTRTTIMGDTLRYNADAFKVATDAEVEALLRKMPGITISDGKIEAHGEDVKQVYVDGVEFFGSNVQQVLQSIPAQAVESIEVYNRLSEASQITGVDDGEGGKVINIITRQGMKTSTFGKVHAGVGYGYNNRPEGGSDKTSSPYRYTAGGSVNFFKEDTRVTVMALVNNLNKQNLTDEGMSVSDKNNSSNASRQFSVNSQQGVASAEIFAINYTDRWGRRRRAKFEGSLFFNHVKATNNFFVDRWYDKEVAKADTIHYDQHAYPDNYTLKFRSRLEWKVAKRQKLILIPTFNYYDNSSLNLVDTTSLRWGESGYRWQPSGNNGWSRTLSTGLYGQYSYKFLKQGRVLMLIASLNHYDNETDRNYYSNSGKTSYESPDLATIKYSYTRKTNDNNTITVRVQPTFREKLGRYTTLNVSYRMQAQLRTRDLYSYATDADYVIDTTRINRRSSSSFEGMYLYHQAGVGFRYGRNRNWFSLNLMYQNSRLSNTNLWTGEHTLKSYHMPVYNATVQWTFNQNHTLRVSANSEVKAPGLWSMIDIYNVDNTQYISKGNPDLAPYTEHNFFARYTMLSSLKGVTFMAMAKATHIQDYIGTAIEYWPATIEVDGKKYNPLQYTYPLNLSGYWSYEGRANVGFPVKWLGSNLNVSVGAQFAEVPVLLNKAKDMMGNLTLYSQWTLGSNISENVDFTLDWRGSYSNNTSSVKSLNNNYFTHRASANVKVVLPLGFTLSSSAIFTQYVGFTNHYNDNFTLWNASIGKKVLRKQGEVELCVNDIMNQNTSFGRHIWAGYSQVRYNTTLGRTYLVKFTYNLRAFASRSKRMRIQQSSGVPYNSLTKTEERLNKLRF